MVSVWLLMFPFGHSDAFFTSFSKTVSRRNPSERVAKRGRTRTDTRRTMALTHDTPIGAHEALNVRCRRSPLGREGLATLALRKLNRQPSWVPLSVPSWPGGQRWYASLSHRHSLRSIHLWIKPLSCLLSPLLVIEAKTLEVSYDQRDVGS